MAERASDLTGPQLELMEVLWTRGEATVAEIHEAVRATRSLAHSTVATLLSRLEKRGLVRRRTVGRQFLYSAAVTREEVRESMVGGLVARLFEGSAAAMVAHLIDAGRVDEQELAEVRALIEQREREGRGDDR